MKIHILLLALVLMGGAAVPAFGQVPEATAPATDAGQDSQPGDKKENGKGTFAGLTFGVGLSYTADTGDNLRVDDASIDVAGIVRVNKRSDAVARIMLESHYFFSRRDDTFGFGPFVSVQPGSDEIINALGAGLMIGMRRDKKANESFNIGLGIAVDPVTKTLGREFEPGKPAPIGPDGKPLAVRYETRSQKGILLLASFSW